MQIQTIFANTSKSLKSNSPEILTALSITGLISTAYLTGKASYKAAEVIDYNERTGGVSDNPRQRLKENVQATWRLYIPAAACGFFSIGCIVGASHASSRRTTAAVAAYSLSERAFSEYREKVIEEIGKGKEQKIRDQIVQDKVSEKPPVSKEVLIAGTGHILCCELYTHRYFRSDMESLRKAQNDVNVRIVNHLYVTLEEFYDLINLPHTSTSDTVGWNSDKLLELQFSTVLSEDGEPCLAFDYNYVKPL